MESCIRRNRKRPVFSPVFARFITYRCLKLGTPFYYIPSQISSTSPTTLVNTVWSLFFWNLLIMHWISSKFSHLFSICFVYYSTTVPDIGKFLSLAHTKHPTHFYCCILLCFPSVSVLFLFKIWRLLHHALWVFSKLNFSTIRFTVNLSFPLAPLTFIWHWGQAILYFGGGNYSYI